MAGFHFFRRNIHPWVIIPVITALIISIPLLIVLRYVVIAPGNDWEHISSILLPPIIRNTLLLIAGVAASTSIIGVSTAWLVSYYHFPGRKLLHWLLILPITIPAYILGFTYTGMLDYTSPLYVFIRNQFGIDTGPYFPFNLMNLPGAIIIFSLSLYPYVYLICRSYFLHQSASFTEVSASLGRSRLYTFFRVVLPVSRPAIIAGVSLVIMEVLNDYGLVKYFGVHTFTTGIFTAWFAFRNPEAALKMSAFLMLLVMVVMIIERFQSSKFRYADEKTSRPLYQVRMTGWKKWLIIIWCFLPVTLGFLLPAIQLTLWTLTGLSHHVTRDFGKIFLNSLGLSAASGIVITLTSLLLVSSLRIKTTFTGLIFTRIATVGYAIPGAVIAVGLLVFFNFLEQSQSLSLSFPGSLALTGTVFGLIFGYLVRFLAVGFQPSESGMRKLPVSIHFVSRSLGHSPLKTLRKIDLPLLRPAIISSFLLVFIDVMKELPLTLILRPFNFDTLAIRSFEYASDERIPEAAPAALTIVILGLLITILLNKLIKSSEDVYS